MFEWITLAAILLGPILAVLTTRYLDNRRATDEQRMAVFKTLMRTRRTPVLPDHVGALNLVEIEFHNCPAVIKAWKDLLTHFATEHSPKASEKPIEGVQEDQRTKQSLFLHRIATERQALLTKLLHAMAKELNFKAEQLEIFEGGYTPQGWFDDDMEMRMARRLFVDIANGQKLFPIGVHQFVQPVGVEPVSDSSGGAIQRK